MAKFGTFQNKGKEFVITDPVTPRPLMNYAWNECVMSGFNQFGGGNGSYGARSMSYIDKEEEAVLLLSRMEIDISIYMMKKTLIFGM